jgi:hypothetical protein
LIRVCWADILTRLPQSSASRTMMRDDLMRRVLVPVRQ